MKRVFRYILFMAFLWASNCFSVEHPQALKGNLNFSRWDFSKSGPLDLKGQWVFYGEKHIDLKKIKEKMNYPKGNLKSVPDQWGNSKGLGTYLLELTGGQKIKLDLLIGPWMGDISVYSVNKEGILSLGKSSEPREIQVSFEHKERSFLVFHVSKDLSIEETFRAPKLGLNKDLSSYKKKTLIKDIIIAGFLLLLALLHVGTFLQRKKEKGALFLGLFSLILFLSWALASKDYFFVIFGPSDYLFSLTKRCEYIGIAICPLLFAFYLNQVFLDHFKKVLKPFIYISSFFAAIVLFIPVSMLTHSFFIILILLSSGPIALYTILYLGILSYRKEKVAGIIFLGALLILISIFIDSQSIAGFPEFSPWLISIFLFFQSQILIHKWNKKSEEMTIILESNERTIAIQEKVMDGNKREMNVLLDNIRQGIFTIDEELTILSPMSKYCESLFRPDITGNSVFEILFKNMKMTGQTYKNLYFTLKDMFLSDRMQFWAIEDKLPHKVDIYSPDGEEKRVYKVSYSPICDRDHNVKRIMFVVQDITQLEEYMTQAEKDQVNFKFIEEILKISDKEKLCLSLEDCIKVCLRTLEDFVSPIANSYDEPYFKGILENVLKEVVTSLSQLENLKEILGEKLRLLIVWNANKEINDYQLEAVEKISNVLEGLLRYSHLANMFFPIKFSLNFSFNKSVVEKIENLISIFDNIFRYAPGLENLDKRKLAFITKVTRMYPDFDQTILIIYQRSKLISFLLKAMKKEDFSNYFQDLSFIIKEIPKREKLNEAILKNNLVIPYRKLVENSKNIKDDLFNEQKNN